MFYNKSKCISSHMISVAATSAPPGQGPKGELVKDA